ncbi:hypothetical protein [Verrucosispora sp. ts21]|uniref:hypothetical protein n=1 Tax=Verrucosispora sp. ts21 TaxID=2069341 RepID=UPI0011AEF041|nr:hypothetical protein [Verrucosispora sp. ts21]
MPRHPETAIIPNSLLADARRRRISPRRAGQRMSRAELADAVNAALDRLYPGQNLAAYYVDHRWVGKLERGEHRWPSRERRDALRQVLSASTDADLGLYSPRRTPDSTPRRPIPDRPRICRSLLDDELACADPQAWHDELDQLTAQPPQTWPELGIRVRERLEILDALQRGGTRPDLAGVDARWSEFMSWIADNTTIAPDGGVWLDRSRRRAVEAGDLPLTAYACMRHSQRALDNGDIRVAITFSRRSLTPGPVPARTRALCLARMAEALAASGNDDDTTAAITAARRELTNVGATTGDDHFARHCDLRYVAAVDARCRYLLGDAASATMIFEELLDDQPPVTLIDIGLWHAHLGECYLHHDPERAAHHGSSALRLADETASYRIIRAIGPLAIALRQHHTLPAVRSFINGHRTAVTRQ